jgi:hypothetical protein
MANEESKDTPAQANAAPRGGQGPLKLMVGVVLLIATGGGIAMMAMPKKARGPETFSGPWSFAFFDSDFIGNTIDDNFSRFIKFAPTCSYFAYEQAYANQRKADPDFLPSIDEAMTNVVASFKLLEIMKDGSGEELALAARLEEVLEPILFPVHVGESVLPLERDPESGLRVGDSQQRFGTFRGAFREHFIEVDARAKTLKLADGDVFTYSGSETDFEVRTADGRKLFVDVTKVKPDFKGKVNAGIQGRIRQVHLGRKIAQ